MLSPLAGTLRVEQVFVFFNRPILSLHFLASHITSPAFPSQFQKLHFPHLSVAGMQSRDPESTNQTRCRTQFRMELCVATTVPKGSGLLENTMTRLLVLPGVQQWLGLQWPGPNSSGQIRQPWCVTRAGFMIWLKPFLLHSFQPCLWMPTLPMDLGTLHMH